MESGDLTSDAASSLPKEDDDVSSPPGGRASQLHGETAGPPRGAAAGAAGQAERPPGTTIIAPGGHAARAAAPGSQSSVFSMVETALKLAAAGLALVAAMGFPAVYLHFSRFNVPTHLASYDHILRAGVLPATLLIFVGTYVYWAWLSYRAKKPKTRFLYVLVVLFMPFTGAALMVMLTGALAAAMLYFWGLFRLVLGLFGSDVSNPTLLIAAAAAIPFSIVIFLLGQRVLPKWLTIRFANSVAPRLVGRRGAARDGIESPPSSPPASGQAADDGPDRLLLVALPLLLIYCVGGLYAIKGVLYLWNPQLSSPLGHRLLLLLGFGCALAYLLFIVAAFAGSWAESGNKKRRFWGFAMLTAIPVAIFLASVALYSYSFYARLPRGLGGGRPDRIVVWVARDDFPPTLQGRLARANCGGDDKTVKCENVHLLYDDASVFVIVDSTTPPASGALLPRDKIRAVSWPPRAE